MAEITKEIFSKIQKNSFEILFSRGQYSQILQHYDSAGSFPAEKLEFLLGALCFQGRTREAEEIFRERSATLQVPQRSAALFYLGLGLARKSRYAEARKLFRLNHELHHQDENQLIQFYIHQGLAFYLYFTGQFSRAVHFAEKSLRAAIRGRNFSAKVLAQDLLGHSLTQVGQIQSGLAQLREARTQAETIGHGAFVSAIEISYLLYEAEFGFRSDTIVQALYSAHQNLSPQDTYSRSAVALEIGRQLMLRGNFVAAQKILGETAPQIYGAQNRRQEIILNLRWAEVAFLQGQETATWQFVRSAQRCLNFEADKNFEIQILELEVKVLENREPELFAQKKARLIELSAKFASQSHRNRLVRRHWLTKDLATEDDEIHLRLKTMEASPEKALATVLETGYYSWFFKILPMERGQNYLYLGLEKSSLTIFSAEEITHQKIPSLARRLLEALAEGAQSKAQIVEKVWGYTYHPLRHDSLVYAGLSSLRKSLGQKAGWILTTETGYALSPGVHLRSAAKPAKPLGSKAAAPAIAKKFMDLNHRQIQALEYLTQQRFLCTRTYKDLFTTSEITASRDLSSLREKGHVVKIGFGRATQYALAGR